MDGGLIAGELTRRTLASAYKQLTLDGMKAEREHPVDIKYEDMLVSGAFRADVIVDERVIVELKAVERILPIHEAQLLTYLRLSGIRVGLLLNFNTRHLRQGIHRFVA